MIRTLFLSAVLIGLGAAANWPAEAWAQSSEPQQATTQSFSEQELKTFAVATLEVERINHKLQQKLLDAENPEQEQEIAEEATDERVSAVEQKGLSVEKYNGMVEAVTSNPALAKQVLIFREEAK